MQIVLLVTSKQRPGEGVPPAAAERAQTCHCSARSAGDGRQRLLSCSIDIDTAGVERIREYTGKTFVIAVTEQERRTRTGHGGCDLRAYEIMQRPLRKERIERVLAELQALRRKWNRRS